MVLKYEAVFVDILSAKQTVAFVTGVANLDIAPSPLLHGAVFTAPFTQTAGQLCALLPHDAIDALAPTARVPAPVIWRENIEDHSQRTTLLRQ